VLRALIEPGHPQLSVRRQCTLLGLSRSSLYYEPAPETEENLRLMGLIDREYTEHPFYGSRRLTAWLVGQGEAVNRKRVQRLMRRMGLEALYPKPRLSAAGKGHRIYPYLLRQVRIERPDQVWSADITYVPLVQSSAIGGRSASSRAHSASIFRAEMKTLRAVSSLIGVSTPPTGAPSRSQRSERSCRDSGARISSRVRLIRLL
jgi:hypothetical protein